MRFYCRVHRDWWDDSEEISCPACRGKTEEQLRVEELLADVQAIRAENNKNWMDILRLAFHHAPEEARALMAKITECDRRINELTKDLTLGRMNK